MRSTKRIRTALYGDQRLSAAELEVIHTPAMQRLYGLRQLGLTDRVFIDASHSRIHHVVGVLQQVDKLTSAIVNNLSRSAKVLDISSPTGGSRAIPANNLARYVRNRKSVIRFIGLLHDLTHAPFGHTIEDEIQLAQSKHDHPKRQAEAFYRLLCQLVAWMRWEAFATDESHPRALKPFLAQGATAPLPQPSEVGIAAREVINGLTEARAELCLKLSPKYIAEMLAHLGCAMTALLYLDALHAEELKSTNLPENSRYPFQETIRTALTNTRYEGLLQEFSFEPHRDAFMLDIVGNTVCADLLDYAGRDSHFAGLRLNYDSDRIAENFTLVKFETVRESETRGMLDPFKGWCIRTAISLVSHKYRTDIPSELMNLLNVRFYLYERVIFHSTKCAAGSMLGTALQLMGWRNAGSDERRKLPKHLEFVGDEVFLHDISAALDFLVSRLQEGVAIDDNLIENLSSWERVHNGVIRELLLIRRGEGAANVLEELNAAQMLLNRLAARRYFRPVFRAMPDSDDEELDLEAGALAKLFEHPDVRFTAEREIENLAKLPMGTITIHCPRRNTAEKIANVLLTKPRDGGGSDVVRSLNNIRDIDDKTFGKHQEAVRAVQEMYRSMWRLTVYAAPEIMEDWRKIEEAAGKVIWKAAYEEHVGGLGTKPCRCWRNDPHLKRELEGKSIGSTPIVTLDSDLTAVGEDLGRVLDELSSSGRISAIPSELYDPEMGFTVEGRRTIEGALTAMFVGAREDAPARQAAPEAPPRAMQIYTAIRTYVKQVDFQDESWFFETYPRRLDPLSSEQFDQVKLKLAVALETSERIDKSTEDHRGVKFRLIMKRVDQFIRSIVGHQRAPETASLFGEESE